MSLLLLKKLNIYCLKRKEKRSLEEGIEGHGKTESELPTRIGKVFPARIWRLMKSKWDMLMILELYSPFLILLIVECLGLYLFNLYSCICRLRTCYLVIGVVF